MNKSYRIHILITCSILILGILTFIQYQLTKDVYTMSREKYYAEVRQGIESITNQFVIDSIEEKSVAHLKVLVREVQQNKMSKQELWNCLEVENEPLRQIGNAVIEATIKNNPILNGIRFKSQYEEIVLEFNGERDTLLSGAEKPFIIYGQAFKTINTLQYSKSNTVSSDSKITDDKTLQYKDRLQLRIKKSQYIDVSRWRAEVWKRMSGIFALATGLIIALIILVYVILNTMLRQKKIAEIKTDFANNITHELKTPLTSLHIIGKSLAKRGIQNDPASFSELIASLQRQSQKIQQIVDNVLETSFLQNVQVSLEAIDLPAFLKEFTADIQTETHFFIAEIAATPARVMADKSKLENVLNNLLENAQKYSPIASPIKLKAYVDAGFYVIEVQDQGKGISRDEQTRIFQKFYRVPESNRHTVKGLGLGLYLSKITIEQFSGKIEVKSKPEQGSTFIIKIPTL